MAFKDNSLVEIGVENYDYFYSIYRDTIEYYKIKYNDKNSIYGFSFL